MTRRSPGNGTLFAVGDRIVVTDKYRGAGCNHDMIGYYGHIVALPAEVGETFYYAKLIGRTSGQPIHPHRVGKIDRFPLYAFEIEHAD